MVNRHVISNFPLTSHLLHWARGNQKRDDVAQGLLEGDSLNIPLDDQRLYLNHPIQRELPSQHHNNPFQGDKFSQNQYLKRVFSRFQVRQVYIVSAMLALVLLFVVAFLGTRTQAAQDHEGILLCGSQRYSISNVRDPQSPHSVLILICASILAMITLFSAPWKTGGVRWSVATDAIFPRNSGMIASRKQSFKCTYWINVVVIMGKLNCDKGPSLPTSLPMIHVPWVTFIWPISLMKTILFPTAAVPAKS